MNDPIPYRISEADVDEVLSAYDVPENLRADAQQHVMRSLLDIDEVVRTAPENEIDRRDVALAEIEEILISDGYIEPEPGEPRIYPPAE
jgi:hypothetical protein